MLQIAIQAVPLVADGDEHKHDDADEGVDANAVQEEEELGCVEKAYVAEDASADAAQELDVRVP